MGINIYYNKVNVMVETIPIIDKNVWLYMLFSTSTGS